MQDNQSLTRFSSPYQLLDLLIRLFTVGIFSTTGGAKAWFELFLVIAALASCGYLIWWQVAFLVLILIFGTLAAGILTFIPPQALMTQQFTSEKFAVTTLSAFSQDKIRETTHLSGNALIRHKDTLAKAARILREHPTLLEDIAKINIVLQNIDQDYKTTQTKIDVEEKKAKAVERQRQADEQEKRRQSAELEKQRQEAERQAATQLHQQRSKAGFAGGHPPLLNGGCPPGYPVKITLNNPDAHHNGIIWKPEDGSKYERINSPDWCFSNVEDAKANSGKYKLRRPMDSKGRIMS